MVAAYRDVDSQADQRAEIGTSHYSASGGALCGAALRMIY
jgi:hypothetical protein